MRRVPSVLGVVVVLLLASVVPATAASPSGAAPGLDGTPVGSSLTWILNDGARVHVHPTRSGRAPIAPYNGTPPMLNHGGPVVPAEHVVSIYWSPTTVYSGGPTPGTTGPGSADGSNVGYFLNNLGGSSYYNINTTYADTVGGGHTVANALAYTGYWADNASAPSGSQNVSDVAIQAEITGGFTSGKIAYDPSTVYAVFSSGSVNLGGGAFTQYCAYHGAFTWNGNTVLYAAMPYNAAAPRACSVGAAPNGDAGADAEVNTLAHELEEANTDPQLNAWYDSSGYENGDECAWIFGTAGLSGGQANITVGARNFMVQENWLNVANGQCLQGYSTAPATVPGAPTLTSATGGGNSVSLSWSAPSSNGGASIAGYAIFRSTTTGGEGATPYATVGTATTYIDTGVSAGTTYYYTVAAINSVGTGGQSNERSATPTTASVPGASTLTATTSSFRRGVQLSWTAAAPNGSSVSSYSIYRSASGVAGTFGLLTTRGGTSTSYRDSSTSSGTRYWYYVAAANASGTGPASNVANAVAR